MMEIKPLIIVVDAASHHLEHKCPGRIFSMLPLSLTHLLNDLCNKSLLVTYYVLRIVQGSGDIMMYEACSLPSKSSSNEEENLQNYQNNTK